MRFLPGRATGLIVVVTATYWWVVFLAMHVLEPEFSPLRVHCWLDALAGCHEMALETHRGSR